MNHKPFPFFAGQHTPEKSGSRCVLSPLPVKTRVPAANSCELLLKKTLQYIDLGGVAGSVFQAQCIYLVFMMGFSVSISMFFFMGGVEGVVNFFYVDKRIAEGQWIRLFNWYECIMTLSGLLMPFSIGAGIAVSILLDGNRQCARGLPLRFHRQRREVMFSRWDAKAKQIETKIVPWEQVCAMVGQGTAFSTGGMYTLSTLFIGANNEDNPGHFWSGLQIGAIHNLAGAAQWELVRQFMEEGPEAIADFNPSPVTFKGLVEDHCRMIKIDVEQFGGWRRFWWEINGTRFGIWLQNYRQSRSLYAYKANPAFEAWSQPIPESQWARPSAELDYYNRMLEEHDYSDGLNILAVSDLRERFGPYPPQAKGVEGNEPIVGESH